MTRRKRCKQCGKLKMSVFEGICDGCYEKNQKEIAKTYQTACHIYEPRQGGRYGRVHWISGYKNGWITECGSRRREALPYFTLDQWELDNPDCCEICKKAALKELERERKAGE